MGCHDLVSQEHDHTNTSELDQQSDALCGFIIIYPFPYCFMWDVSHVKCYAQEER